MDPKKVQVRDEDLAMAFEQERLATRVVIPATGGYTPQAGAVVLALDIQYDGDLAHVAGDLSYWQGKHIGVFAGQMVVKVAYAPTFFCFREGPPLLALIARLRQESQPEPNVILVDGYGLAHPRRFGVACWLGIATDKPTIGCAKNALLDYDGELAEPRGSKLPILLENETVGYVLRSQAGINPIYVSPGHLVSLSDAVEIVLGLGGDYRIPNCLRHVDHAARSHAKGNPERGWHDLGELTPVATPF